MRRTAIGADRLGDVEVVRRRRSRYGLLIIDQVDDIRCQRQAKTDVSWWQAKTGQLVARGLTLHGRPLAFAAGVWDASAGASGRSAEVWLRFRHFVRRPPWGNPVVEQTAQPRCRRILPVDSVVTGVVVLPCDRDVRRRFLCRAGVSGRGAGACRLVSLSLRRCIPFVALGLRLGTEPLAGDTSAPSSRNPFGSCRT